MTTISRSYSVSRLEGKKTFKQDDYCGDFSATGATGTNPNLVPVIGIGVSTYETGGVEFDVDIPVLVRIQYYITFFDRQNATNYDVAP